MSQKTNPNLGKDYLRWLEPQLRSEQNPQTRTYWDLTNVMFEKEFTVSADIPMDNNRAVDGLDLRVEFAHEQRLRPAVMKALGAVSFLEVLIGLSRRLEFMAGGNAPGWAWELLGNLELHRMADPLSASKHQRTQDIMDVVIERTYQPDGTGGFFPLTRSDDDQTQIELWYQMNSFVEELHPEH